jgi:hypothetical protein
MLNRFHLRIATALMLLTSGAAQADTPAPAAAKAASTVADIQACMSANLVGRAALRDLGVKVTDRENKQHNLRMKLYWKPGAKGETRLNLRLLEPAATRGSSYLMLQSKGKEEVYFWLPAADRALRITGENTAEPLWGTDFSYGEIKQVLGLLAVGESTLKADAKVGARTAWVLETQTSMAESGYQKVLSYVDQTSCTLLKSEFFAKAETPRKVLEADLASLFQIDKYWTVLGYTMRDLRAGSRTEISLSEFSIDERLPEYLFEPKRFFEPFD